MSGSGAGSGAGSSGIADSFGAVGCFRGRPRRHGERVTRTRTIHVVAKTRAAWTSSPSSRVQAYSKAYTSPSNGGHARQHRKFMRMSYPRRPVWRSRNANFDQPANSKGNTQSHHTTPTIAYWMAACLSPADTRMATMSIMPQSTGTEAPTNQRYGKTSCPNCRANVSRTTDCTDASKTSMLPYHWSMHDSTIRLSQSISAPSPVWPMSQHAHFAPWTLKFLICSFVVSIAR
mmetsp:Transcript_66912/g.156878  ORF Transcript_66912/g.156878 Transcript_66912/m.156878 type:complete len:232 (-) Transcript_66912:1138-1833(-)